VIEAPLNINRRKFINGRWSTRAGSSAPGCAEIASILVQTRPEKLARAIDAIETLPGTEIFGHDPKGKIVVVIEASDVSAIGETLGAISALPDVLTASLVFHGTTE
jgi:nitrate reductase NapD